MINEQAAPTPRRRRGALPVTGEDTGEDTGEAAGMEEGAVSQDFPEPEEDPAEAKRKEEEALTERLQAFGGTLSSLRDRWIVSRRASGVDQRWGEDHDQYHCIDAVNRAAAEMMTSVEQGYPVTTHGATAHRSTVYVGITRQKTNAAEARLSDILIPTDDKNWGVGPTPNPTLAGQMQDETPVAPDAMGNIPQQPVVDPNTGEPAADAQGKPLMQPMRKKDIAAAVDKQARDTAQAMEREIDDQLTQCDYQGELRKMLHDAAMLGTGVMKGPVVTNRTRKAWVPQTTSDGKTIHTLAILKESDPASFRVDPRNMVPDPACGDDIQKGRGIFERELMTKRAVQDLAKQDNYLLPALRQVLLQSPTRVKALEQVSDKLRVDLASSDQYEVWHYVGELDIADLRAAGVKDLPEDEDPLTVLSGCVVMINGIVVKAYLNPLETGDLPYDFYPWEKVSDSVWGFGVPYLMRAQQRVLNAAWRQMMDNAGLSSGAMVVMRRNGIYPADGQWVLSARKIWYANDDVEDVEKAFQLIEIPMHQPELAAIIAMAQDLADKETGSPQLTQGEQGSAPDTVGGMQLLMNNANVVLRRLVKQFDDYVTKKHIQRYYDFNMCYSEKPEIKGDFMIKARGSSALLVRDAQNTALTNLLQLAQSPGLAPLVKMRDLFVKVLEGQHLHPDDIVKSEEQIKTEAAIAAKNPPQDPRIQAAMVIAKARVEDSKARADGYASEIELRRDIANQNQAANLIELQVQREIEMLKLANSQKLSLEQVKAQLAAVAINDRTKKELFAAEASLKLNPANISNEGV